MQLMDVQFCNFVRDYRKGSTRVKWKSIVELAVLVEMCEIQSRCRFSSEPLA